MTPSKKEGRGTTIAKKERFEGEKKGGVECSRRPESLRLKIVRAEPNDCTAKIFAIQSGLTALPKSRISRMACVMPDVLEVENPQATELVTDDVSACQVAVDES